MCSKDKIEASMKGHFLQSGLSADGYLSKACKFLEQLHFSFPLVKMWVLDW